MTRTFNEAELHFIANTPVEAVEADLAEINEAVAELKEIGINDPRDAELISFFSDVISHMKEAA